LFKFFKRFNYSVYLLSNHINIKRRIKHIDGLRGLAIIGVFGYHLFTEKPQDKFLEYIFSYGNLGVNLFFLISGFVIFLSLEKSLNYISFIKKRYFRLFPSMLFVSILYVCLFYPINEIDLIPGLTLVDPRIINFFTGLNTKAISIVFWTLFIEFQFYIIVGFSYFFLKEKTGILIGFLYLFYLGSKFFNLYFPNLIFAYFYDFGKILGLAWFSWFATGIYIYKLINTKKIFYFYLICIFTFLSALHLTAQYNNFYLFIWAFFINLLFFFSFFIQKISAFFIKKTFLSFGIASYPLYLIHYILLFPIQTKFEKIFGLGLYYAYSLITFLGIFFFSLCIAKYYEPLFKK
jgi:peptidoglycan/LPS O-acetylase OafA/YrhL